MNTKIIGKFRKRWLAPLLFVGCRTVSVTQGVGDVPTMRVLVNDVEVALDHVPTVKVGDRVRVEVGLQGQGSEARIRDQQLLFETMSDWSSRREATRVITKDHLRFPWISVIADSRRQGVPEIEVGDGRRSEVMWTARIAGGQFPKGHTVVPAEYVEESAIPVETYGVSRREALMPLRLDSTLDPETRAMLVEASGAMTRVALSPDVWECARSRSWLEVPIARSYFQAQLFEALTRGLYLKRVVKNGETEIVGVAYAEKYLFYGEGALMVRLNARYIGKGSKGPEGMDPVFVAGIIGHEILHNLGYDHIDRMMDATRGYFIHEYGDCVAEALERLKGKE